MTWLWTGPQDYIIIQSWTWQLLCDAYMQQKIKPKVYVFLWSDEKKKHEVILKVGIKCGDFQSRHSAFLQIGRIGTETCLLLQECLQLMTTSHQDRFCVLSKMQYVEKSYHGPTPPSVWVGPVPLSSAVQWQLIPAGTLDYHLLSHQIPREKYKQYLALLLLSAEKLRSLIFV